MQVCQPFVDETGANDVLVPMQQHAFKVAPVTTGPPIKNPGLPDSELDRVCLDNVEAHAELQVESVLPEMLRLEEYLEK